MYSHPPITSEDSQREQNKRNIIEVTHHLTGWCSPTIVTIQIDQSLLQTAIQLIRNPKSPSKTSSCTHPSQNPHSHMRSDIATMPATSSHYFPGIVQLWPVEGHLYRRHRLPCTGHRSHFHCTWPRFPRKACSHLLVYPRR